MLDTDRVLGALLGSAIGDALGMPIDGLSHQNVRTYYKGIKGFRADEKRGDLEAGQWTAHTQHTFALVRALTLEPGDLDGAHAAFREALDALNLRRAESNLSTSTSAAAACAAPLGIAWHAHGWDEAEALRWTSTLLPSVSRHPASLAAAFGQAVAICRILRSDVEESPPLGEVSRAVGRRGFSRLSNPPQSLRASPPRGAGTGSMPRLNHLLSGDIQEAEAFVRVTAAAVAFAEDHLESDHAVSDRLGALAPHLDEFPLDLQDRCNGTGTAAAEAFPFALAMFARGPALAEASLLAAINVGGAASAVGAMLGALLGAHNGTDAFPTAWHEGLEDRERLRAEAGAFADSLDA